MPSPAAPRGSRRRALGARASRTLTAWPALAAVLALTTCRSDQGPEAPSQPLTVPRPSFATTPPGAVTLVGTGNIARCDRTSDEATAALLDSIPGTVFALGDNTYPGGTASSYANCYNASWGRHQARTYPALGNHDYDSSATAAGYFGYFGAAAGDPTKGYYSYDLGAWHVVVLNSNNSFVSTAVGSPQETWLKADLAATTKQCIVALWHHPRFYSTTSSSFSPNTSVKPFWDDLSARHATLIINAHMRDYERFAPQTSAGVADPVNGIREIIIGTGGEGLDAANTLITANSEARISGVYGVLKLTLYDGSYSWQFVPVAGQTASDAGSATCYIPGPAAPSVNAGPDLTAAAGDSVTVTATFTDPGPNDAPWTYTMAWGDGASSTGTTTSLSTPITASHVYAAPGLDSVRVTVTNALGITGSDSLSVLISTPGAAILVGAGDIADSTTKGDSLTANLLDSIAGTVFTLGDNAYPMGTSSDYTKWYAPTWGRHLARTRPVPGNHEYTSSGVAPGYFGYYGAAAGDPAKGYYSYNLGDWHIIALNGELDVSPTSAQVQWLRTDLALYSKRCTLAYWHEPRFVSGVNTTSNPKYQTLWDTLYQYGADVVVNGHKHSYERLAPQNPAALLDTVYGIREFVVGTGGTGLDGGSPPPVLNSQVRNTTTWGVLKLTLNSGGYTWQFIPVAGQTFADAGSGLCHDAPSAINHPPTAAPGGPYTGSEGSGTSFNGSASSDPDGDALTYAWSFGDGTTGTGVTPSHTYADNGSYTVSLTVTDSKGAASAPVTTTATIANAPPLVTLPANQSGTAGSAYALSATFSDAGVNDSPWSYTIDWGDGSTATTGSTTSQSTAITASHTYAAAGTDTVRVTVTDKDGGAGSAKTPVTVTVVNHPPTAAPGGPYSGMEGAAVALNGSGSSDPDGDAITYAWSFGDGTTGTGATPSHVYADNGSYTVSLTVTDSKGAPSTAATATATIANVPPTVSVPTSLAANTGSPLTLSATFSDPGTHDSPWSYAITWGDGTAATTGSVTSQTGISAAHTYAASGSNTAIVTVTDKDGGTGSGQTAVTVSQPVASVTLVGAGNIARCDRTNDEATATVLDGISGTVFALGDAAYPNGTPTNYANCYNASWGRHLARTYPALGNHDYDSSATAIGYFGYFGAAAGDPTKGYYSYDIGAWHIIVLNSNNSFVSTAAGSPQETWLKADLAATTKQCVLAMWHSPRFYSTTSSSFFPTSSVKPFWDDLYAAHAELIINSHMRDYERFAPQTPAGAADPTNGIREIIVGTGGEGLDGANTLITANSEVRISGVYGVLKLTLYDGSYSWQFVPVAGQTASDAGSGSCH